MKLLVIGGSAGGASTAARVRRLNEEAEITIFEKGRDVSFSNCSLPYYTGGVVESSEDLIMMFPEDFKAKHNIDVYTQTEVLKINRAEKTITVKDLKTEKQGMKLMTSLYSQPGRSRLCREVLRAFIPRMFLQFVMWWILNGFRRNLTKKAQKTLQ